MSRLFPLAAIMLAVMATTKSVHANDAVVRDIFRLGSGLIEQAIKSEQLKQERTRAEQDRLRREAARDLAENKKLQRSLFSKGCYFGKIDGIIGPQTIAAQRRCAQRSDDRRSPTSIIDNLPKTYRDMPLVK